MAEMSASTLAMSRAARSVGREGLADQIEADHLSLAGTLRRMRLALGADSLQHAALLVLVSGLVNYLQDRDRFDPEPGRAAALFLLGGDAEALRALAIKARTFA